MQKSHHLGALALLGALILYFFLWPICCCAAKPAWSPLATDINMQIPPKENREHGFVNSTQTYHTLMTTPGINDNATSTNGKFLDLSVDSSGNQSDKSTMVNSEESNRKNLYEIIDDGEVSVMRDISSHTEPMTTSIYELFEVKKRKTKSKNQILSRTDRSVHLNSSNSNNNSVSGAKRVRNNKTKQPPLDRNERSANLSHIAGSARKIQLYIKNRFLQLLPDGTVNGTTDDLSDYSKLNL
jgi:hypothetical protein